MFVFEVVPLWWAAVVVVVVVVFDLVGLVVVCGCRLLDLRTVDLRHLHCSRLYFAVAVAVVVVVVLVVVAPTAVRVSVVVVVVAIGHTMRKVKADILGHLIKK